MAGSFVTVTKKTDRLHELINKGDRAAIRIQETHVKSGTDYMVSIMPEKTGTMKRETKAVFIQGMRSRPGWGIRIGVDYWRYPNDGTAHIEGQHFVERAIERIRSGMAADFQNFESFVR